MAWEKPQAGIVAQLGMPEADVAWGEAAGNFFFFASGATAEMAFLHSQAAKSAQCSDHCLGHLMAEDDLLPPGVQDGAVGPALVPVVTAAVALSCPESGCCFVPCSGAG